jgi:hypothetical protein
MMRFAIIFLTAISLLIAPVAFHPAPVEAQRFAECDVCGYCQGMAREPGAWKACAYCMYPGLPKNDATRRVTVNASENRTLKVDEDPASVFYNVQATPAPGKYYTQLGCVSTQLGNFTERGAAGSLVNILLQTIFTTAGGIAFLYLIYGAYVVMTAKGDPGSLNRGKSIIYGAIIGVVFIMAVTLILNLIGNGILRIPGFGV